jgi:diguanylate cyclase (GGDEF)-like protein/PAS domain S-box-containing protein
LLLAQLRKDGLVFVHRLVTTEHEFRHAILDFSPQVIVSDFTLPRFDGLGALTVARSLAPSTPFLFVSGTIGEERAIAALKSGAADYVLKDNLTRLVPAIKNAIRQAETVKARDLAEGMLRDSESRLQDIINTSSDWIWECDAQSSFTFSSPSIREILGHDRHDVLAKSVFAYLEPDDRPLLESTFDGLRNGGDPHTAVTLRWIRKDGATRSLERKMVILRDENGRVRGFRGIDRDVTERKQQEKRITRLNRALTFLSGTNSAILRIRDRGELLKEACRIAVQIGGYGMATVYVRSLKTTSTKPNVNRAVSRKHSDSPRPPVEPLEGDGPVAQALLSAKPVIIEDIEDIVNSGESVPNRDALLTMGLHSCIALPLVIDETAVGVIQLHSDEAKAFQRDELSLLHQLGSNIAFALQQLHHEENARYLQYFDPRTSLANRTLFLQRLERMVDATASEGNALSLLVVDLTELTVINDRLGHNAGDLLIQLTAERLKNEFIDSRRLCHLGAGRFAIVCRLQSDSEGSDKLRERVDALFAEPFQISDQELHGSARTGLAQYPVDAQIAEHLLQRAETALERAKRSGDTFVRHTPDMSTEASTRLSLTNQVRQFAAERQFLLNYQPTFGCASGRIEGVEALLRWPDSETGSISPGVFVPMLESLGLIDSVGTWVMQRALSDVQSHLLEEVTDRLTVAVNVSPLQLKREEFVDDVLNLMETFADDRVRLALEVTESTLLADPHRASEMLSRLRDAGIGVAIDDFGTGHSSLTLLSQLPVDVLKIDRSFVRDLATNRNHFLIVRTTLMLAKSLGLITIAEGVETREQLEILTELGCDAIQGFYTMPPTDIVDLKNWLHRQKNEVPEPLDRKRRFGAK